MINKKDAKDAARVIRAINHKMRQEILGLLGGGKELCVTDLYVALKTDQTIMSSHLNILRSIGVLQTRREGKKVFYTLVEPRMIEINRYAGALAIFLQR